MSPYYNQDGITIYHGDCREVLPTLGDVDLIATDPPYGVSYVTSWRSRSDKLRAPIASSTQDPVHPTVKPISLMERIICWSTDEGETVLDCFAGSGPTLAAAKRTSRKAIGIELNERYCEIAANRLSQGVLF